MEKEQEKKVEITEKEALVQLQNGFERAEVIIRDMNKMEALIKAIESQKIGKEFKKLPILLDLTKDYVKKKYTKIPIKSIIAVVSALIYFINPFDIFHDGIPLIGHVDDLAVIGICWKLIKQDIEEYLDWKEKYKEEVEEA
jgi:uncharacterized membrane protein YkvA (DUF1232 family)